jgi:hypothetical protein
VPGLLGQFAQVLSRGLQTPISPSVPREQALSGLRAQRGQANVTLQAGARQVLRMTLARPPADYRVRLPGRRRERH